MDKHPLLPRLVLAIALLGGLAASGSALEVTLRLVSADAPDQGVGKLITVVDFAAEKAAAAAKADAAAPKADKRGAIEVVDQEVVPKAEFDRYTSYMRGITIDRTHPFQRSYQGSYLGRSDTITISLADGEHRIDPGAHLFRIADGVITTSDSDLLVRGAAIDITVYPVSIIAVDGSALRPMPAEARRLPVAMRVYCGSEDLLAKEEGLAENPTFKRLTLYMLGNTTEAGYRLSPSDVHFHLSAQGATIVDGLGKPLPGSGAGVENRFTIVLPRVSIPIRVLGTGVQAVISGPGGQAKVATGQAPSRDDIFSMYPAAAGAQITVGRKVAGQPFQLSGDLGAFPRRRILVDATASAAGEPRLMVTALAAFSTEVGKGLRARVQVVDALDAATLAPLQVAAFIARSSVLGSDGRLVEAPAATDSAWLPLRVTATPDADLYDLVMPPLPSSVYHLRIVAGRRGECRPDAALHADFVHGVIDAATPASLSVFSPGGRHAFASDADIPFSVVLKSTVPVGAGTLSVVLRRDGTETPVLSRELSGFPAGAHPLHWTLAATTLGLAPGDYEVIARLGAVVSNRWPLRLVQARWRGPFPTYIHGWGGTANITWGTTFHHLPKDIAEANRQRDVLQRNAEVHAKSSSISMPHLGTYGGRDASSEIVAVERILAGTLALPAPEVYYYQDYIESVCEALMGQGMGLMDSVIDLLTSRSLEHSVQQDIHSRMRHFQLSAQAVQPFENYLGMALVNDDTTPIGDSENPDQGRGARLIQQRKNFVAKHGFGPPAGGDARAFLLAFRDGKVTPALAEAAKRWETWVTDENSLMGEFYGTAHAALDPLLPRVKTFFQTGMPPETWTGSYPEFAHKNHDVISLTTGGGDVGQKLILESFLNTRFFAMSGADCWGALGFNWRYGPENMKNIFAGFLAGGAKGIGYYNGFIHELTDPTFSSVMGITEERRDMAALIDTYGALLREVKPVAEIGILYPFRQTTYEVLEVDLGRGPMTNAKDSTFSCLTKLAMLGHTGEIITETMLDTGAHRRFTMIIVPELHYCLVKHRQALEQFVKDGGRLLIGSNSTLKPAGAQVIDDDFTEFYQANQRWTYNYLLDNGHAWLFAEVRRRLPTLRAALAPLITPFARPTTDRVLVQTSRAGGGRYTFVWNNSYPSWLGTKRVSGHAGHSAGDGEGTEQTLMPLRETVEFPAAMTTYDLFTQQAIAGPVTNGRIAGVADLSLTPFRIFVSLPTPIAALGIAAPEAVAAGQRFVVTVTPQDAKGGAIDAAIPLRLELIDHLGKRVGLEHHVTTPSCAVNLLVPRDASPGRWSIRVAELVSGRTAAFALTVRAAAAAQTAVVRDLPLVDSPRAALLRDFVTARKQDGAVVAVVLGESGDGRRAMAEQALAALVGLGVKAEIKHLSDADLFAPGERLHLYKNWREIAPGQFIDRHLLLIGGEGEHLLIEELQEARLIKPALTTSYPGPGRGLVTLVRSPFAFGRDVLCVLAPDDAGLRAAIAGLPGLIAAPAPAPAAAAEPAAPDVTQTLPGDIVAGTPFATMDGAMVETTVVSPDGGRIAFGTRGYAKNLFVFDPAGNLLIEDKVGHVNTNDIIFAGKDRLVVASDSWHYLREGDGTLSWRTRGVRFVDRQGRYLLMGLGRGFSVHDAATRALLWKVDEWDRYQNTTEMLSARKATFLAAVDDGRTIIYRLAGKEPGMGGQYADELVFCDALSGAQQRRLAIDLGAITAFAGTPPVPKPDEEVGVWSTIVKDVLGVHNDGEAFTVTVSGVNGIKPGRSETEVVLDAQLKPLRLKPGAPPSGVGYLGDTMIKTNLHELRDLRQIYTFGDSLGVSATTKGAAATVRTDHIILSLAVDETRGRIAVANYSGHVQVFDLDLQPVWRAELDSAATLAFLPDGRLAAGTVRGQAALLGLDGSVVWTKSLNRYAEPEAVESRWTALESTPLFKPAEARRNWWERLEDNVGLGKDLVALSGPVSATALTAVAEGAPFATYLVEWRHRRTAGDPVLTLEVLEQEQGQGDAHPPIHRLDLTGRAQADETIERALLRLGDRPERMLVTVRASGGTATSTLSIRPLAFPSANLIRIDSLYRGTLSEAARAAPPAVVDLFHGSGGADQSPVADSTCLINGRLFDPDAQLFSGNWFSTNANVRNRFPMIPCWVELKLSEKKVISHLVIAEDPNQERVSMLSIDAFVESRDNRKNLTDFEQRQVRRGFWLNLGKLRDNTEAYNVFKLDKPVFTDRLRVYVLGGHSSINEIEVYGAMPTTTPAVPAQAGAP